MRLHDRALRRAEQLGMGRIAVSISHEREYAVAIAFGIRTAGGAFLFPPDIEERLDDQERRIRNGCGASASWTRPRASRSRDRTAAPEGSAGALGRGAAGRPDVAPLLPARPRGHKGTFGTLMVVAGSLDYLGAALLVSLAAVRAGTGLVCAAVPRSLQGLVAGRVMEVVTLGLPERSPGEVDPDGAAEAIRRPCTHGAGHRLGAPARGGDDRGPGAPAARRAVRRTPRRCRPRSWMPRP